MRAQAVVDRKHQEPILRLVLIAIGAVLAISVSAHHSPAQNWAKLSYKELHSTRKHLTWSDYGGSSDGAQYSALHEINRSNVSKLQQVWSYRTGDDRKYLFNPLVVDETMYVLAKDNAIVALDAATGRKLWSHVTVAQATLITNRGMNYWESADRSDRRLIFSVNNALQEIDARTGRPILQFGMSGHVDLREGLGRDPKSLALVQS